MQIFLWMSQASLMVRVFYRRSDAGR